jgi:hypothetical protein
MHDVRPVTATSRPSRAGEADAGPTRRQGRAARSGSGTVAALAALAAVAAALVAVAAALAPALAWAEDAGRPAPDAGPGRPGPPGDAASALVPNPPRPPGALPADAGPPAEDPFAVAARLDGLARWTVFPVAHLRRGARHVVVVWPAIDSDGRLVDATVVGVCLVEGPDGGLVQEGRRWAVRDAAAARAATVHALGGESFDAVTRSDGVPLASLGPALAAAASGFSTAVHARENAAAARAVRALASLVPVERAAFENVVARLLWLAATHRGGLRHVRTTRDGERATLVLDVVRGDRRVRTVAAGARRVPGGPDRWLVVDADL